MTKHEVKQENKQSEGDPHLKAAIRSKQLAMSRNRMMSQVGTADVVVVNPTHVAVALRYQPERGAPRVVAKGADALAARIRDESERAEQVSRTAHETPPLWREPFTPPRPGRVTSGYGRARMFNGTLASRHMGTDFAGQTGAPVRASNRGVVRLVDRFYYGGNVVYLDHGAGLVTAYLHLSETLVAPGDTLERGALVGRVGATGRVTGPHLHLIARYGAVTVDAMSLFTVTAPPPRPKAAPRRSRSPR
jgi:murein DD-endopeptidase MepM/ murein hydrolase activator NlpD